MIKQQLDGASINSQAGINERARALKWLPVHVGKRHGAFLSDVVKNVIAKDVQVKKLVYMYLTRARCRLWGALTYYSRSIPKRDMSSPMCF